MANYSLRDNPFTPDPADRIAKIEGARSYTTTEIVRMVVEEGSTLTQADVEGSVHSFFQKCAGIIAEGGNLNLEILGTSMSISGVFANADDSFDPKRHTLKLNATPGPLLKEALKSVKLTKVEEHPTGPHIVAVTDKVSGSVDGDIKAGGVVQLSGSRLKFDAADAEQGVFVVTAAGEQKCPTVVENRPARVVVLLPADLAAGEAALELRTRLTASQTPGKALKKVRYGRTLTVTAE